jgi:hypothetical protein
MGKARVIRMFKLDELKSSVKRIPNRTSEDKGCIEHQLVTTKEGGYAQFTVLKACALKPLCHHIAFFAEYPDQLQRFVEDEDLQVSHLCGNAKCITPAHLILEGNLENQKRKGCPGNIVVTQLDGTKAQLKLCPHNPPCIASTRPHTLSPH